MNNPPSVLSSRQVYAQLIKLYPRAHRDAYAVSMLQVFTDQCRAAFQARGRMGVFFLWLRTLPDLGYSAVVEHISSPTSAWGVMEPVPNAPLPWKGVLLILLPGLVYLISQIAQLTGQPWYVLVYYRAAFFLILPPLFVWIFTRRFPLWGLIPVGLLFRLLQEIGYQLIVLHPGAFSSNAFLNAILDAARLVQANPIILAGIFSAAILVLAWRYLRRRRASGQTTAIRNFWVWTGVYLLVGFAQVFLSWRWILLPATGEIFPGVTSIDAWQMFWSSFGWSLYNGSALLLLIFFGTLFTRRHGLFSILILLGYLLPTMVVGIPWNLEGNTAQLVFISAGVLTFRLLLAFVTPLWMSRTPSQSGKQRVVLILCAVALAVHAGMQLYPGILMPLDAGVPADWFLTILLMELQSMSALLLGLALYREEGQTSRQVERCADVPAELRIQQA